MIAIIFAVSRKNELKRRLNIDVTTAGVGNKVRRTELKL
jgi:hypothetical protein